MKNIIEEKNQSEYVILINCINKYTSSSSVIGFTDNIEDADYIFRNLHFKTCQVKGDYVYFLQYIPAVGKIENNISLVYIGDRRFNIYNPIYAYPTYEKAQEKAKEIQETTDYFCVLNYTEKLTKEWATNFTQPPKYSWN